jgi:hypothetical protein
VAEGRISTVIHLEPEQKACCAAFEAFHDELQWIHVKEESVRIWPHLLIRGTRWRINFCPSCGKDIRELVERNYQ